MGKATGQVKRWIVGNFDVVADTVVSADKIHGILIAKDRSDVIRCAAQILDHKKVSPFNVP